MTIKQFLIVCATLLAVVVGLFVFAIAKLLSDVKKYEAYWGDRAKAPVPENAIIYYALGDSAAQGLGATRPEKGYVGLVAEYLASKYNRPVHIVNVSKSGAKLEDLRGTQIKRLSDELKPDIVTVEIGANEIIAYNEQQFKKEFEDILSKLPRNTYVANIPSFRGGRYRQHATTAAEASKVADDLIWSKGMIRVDLFEHTNSRVLGDLAIDLVHPSDQGYQKWADAFINELESSKMDL